MRRRLWLPALLLALGVVVSQTAESCQGAGPSQLYGKGDTVEQQHTSCNGRDGWDVPETGTVIDHRERIGYGLFGAAKRDIMEICISDGKDSGWLEVSQQTYGSVKDGSHWPRPGF